MRAARAVVDRWFTVAVCGAGVLLVLAGSGSWFTLDDWMFLGSRRDVLADDGVVPYLLRSHNDHLMAGAVAWQHVLVALFGLGSYLPSTLSIVAVHMAIAVAMRRILVRLGVGRPLASASAVLLMLWGPATGTLIWGLDAVFPLTLGLFLAQLLLVWHAGDPDRRDVAGTVIGLLAVATHTVGALGVVVIVGYLAATRGRRAAGIAALPLVPYVLWWITYRQQAPVYLYRPPETAFSVPGSTLTSQLDFARTLLSTPLTSVLPQVAGLGLLVLAVVVVLRLDARRADPRRAVLLAFLAFAVLFAASTAHSRGFAGAGYAAEDRYLYVATLLTFPFLVLALQHLGEVLAGRFGTRVGAVSVAGVVAVVALANGRALVHERRGYLVFMRHSHAVVLEVAALDDLDDLPGRARIGGTTWDLDVDHVRRLVREGLLPTDTDVDPVAQALLRESLLRQASTDPGHRSDTGQ